MTPIKSLRLSYKLLVKNDLKYHLMLATNEKVMYYVTGKPYSIDEGTKRFYKILTKYKHDTPLGIYTVWNENEEFIGIGKAVPWKPKELEVGYLLLPEFWGVGYGTEISAAMIELAKSIPSIDKLVAIIDPANIASEKILKKSNFILAKKCRMKGLPAAIYEIQIP